MIDIKQILTGMATAIQSAGFPDGSNIASILGLDLSAATITATDGGALAITGAHLAAQPSAEIGVAARSKPKRTLDCVLFNSDVSVTPYIGAVLGDDQRIEPSKHGEGLTIAFRMNGVDCGITASGQKGVIETLFCVN